MCSVHCKQWTGYWNSVISENQNHCSFTAWSILRVRTVVIYSGYYIVTQRHSQHREVDLGRGATDESCFRTILPRTLEQSSREFIYSNDCVRSHSAAFKLTQNMSEDFPPEPFFLILMLCILLIYYVIIFTFSLLTSLIPHSLKS